MIRRYIVRERSYAVGIETYPFLWQNTTQMVCSIVSVKGKKATTVTVLRETWDGNERNMLGLAIPVNKETLSTVPP